MTPCSSTHAAKYNSKLSGSHSSAMSVSPFASPTNIGQSSVVSPWNESNVDEDDENDDAIELTASQVSSVSRAKAEALKEQ